MGFVDKFKGFFVTLDDDYEDEAEFAEKPAPRSTESVTEHEIHYAGEEKMTRKGNKVVNIHATTQLQVILVKPEQFEEASVIADHLNSKRTVVLNLESASKELSRRLIDFLSGVAYANNGQIKRVANSTFIITPYNVDIMGELLDELESNGVYF